MKDEKEYSRYEKRMEICKACEFFDRKLKRCKDCGCFLIAKARLGGAKCPQGKWEEIN